MTQSLFIRKYATGSGIQLYETPGPRASRQIIKEEAREWLFGDKSLAKSPTGKIPGLNFWDALKVDTYRNSMLIAANHRPEFIAALFFKALLYLEYATIGAYFFRFNK